jgi:hypothetical protein
MVETCAEEGESFREWRVEGLWCGGAVTHNYLFGTARLVARSLLQVPAYRAARRGPVNLLLLDFLKTGIHIVE